MGHTVPVASGYVRSTWFCGRHDESPQGDADAVVGWPVHKYEVVGEGVGCAVVSDAFGSPQ
jgi:hypothetical protein